MNPYDSYNEYDIIATQDIQSILTLTLLELQSKLLNMLAHTNNA